jgi:hypothetical protein
MLLLSGAEPPESTVEPAVLGTTIVPPVTPSSTALIPPPTIPTTSSLPTEDLLLTGTGTDSTSLSSPKPPSKTSPKAARRSTSSAGGAPRIRTLEEQIAYHRASWECCWNWPGPKVGGLCAFGDCVATDVNGNTVYVYTTPARILELTDTHIRLRSVATMWKSAQRKGRGDKTEVYWTNEREPYSLIVGREFYLPLTAIWPLYHDEVISDDGKTVTTVKMPHPSEQ